MLARKRREYRDYLPQFYDISPAERTEDETNALRQASAWSAVLLPARRGTSSSAENNTC